MINMELTLDEIKLYLRIDEFEDSLLQSFLNFSENYIYDCTGKKSTDKDGRTYTSTFAENESYKLAQLLIIADLYENRTSTELSVKTVTMLNVILRQLTYCYASTEAKVL